MGLILSVISVVIVAVLLSVLLPPLMLKCSNRLAQLIARLIKLYLPKHIHKPRISSEYTIREPNIVNGLLGNSPSHISGNKTIPESNSIRNFNYSSKHPPRKYAFDVVSKPIIDKLKHYGDIVKRLTTKCK